MRMTSLRSTAAISVFLATSAVRAETESATLTVLPADVACETARLGEAQAQPDERGRFVFRPVLIAPAELVFECGRKYSFYLAPGDDMTVRLQADGILFEGRGAVANRYLAAPSAVSDRQLMAGVARPWEVFATAWAQARQADLKRLAAIAADVSPDFLVRERARVDYRWARGQVMFPFMHWRETDAPALVPDGPPVARMEDVPVEAPEWSALPEYQDFLGAYLHEQARSRIAADPALQTGDNRWLRAELAAARELRTPSLRLAQVNRLMEAHVADNGTKGIEAIWPDYLALSPPPEVQQRIEAAIAADHAKREGHRIEVYRTVDGVALDIHVLPPTAGDTGSGAGPAMLWFHGGSWTEGTWWHCPVICQSLRENGITVLAVELRTGNRFDSGPLEYLDDATAAYRWVEGHAVALGVDENRIGVAGFSSGGTLALMLATRGFDAADGTPARYPGAVIVMGGCANPIGPEEDGWFRRRVAEQDNPADYSPIDRVGSGQPPLLAVHASRDEYCSHAQMQAFVARYRAAGSDAALVSVADVGHFFPFYFPPGVKQTQQAVADAMVKWGWRDKPPTR